MAILCAAYGWTPDQVVGMTPAQVRYFLRNLPDVHLREAYPLAALEATIMNALGGKPDPNDKESKAIPPERAYSPLERLPWYARPAWIDEVSTSIPQDAARNFLANRRHLPDWVVAIAPVSEITAAAG